MPPTARGARDARGTTPNRQIRACYDSETITVYQAYNEDIANAAVSAQKLDASPLFRHARMTWIKPSWSWMLYRAGYSTKDPGQARILAIKMKHADFLGLLERGELARDATPKSFPKLHSPDDSGNKQEGAAKSHSPSVRIQWDPERTVRLEKLGHRSIQIGIPAALSSQWTAEWIVSIIDVTDKAKELKETLDEHPDISDEDLVERGLVPVERPYVVPEGIRAVLKMDSKE